MQVSPWTTSYSSQYRHDGGLISPNAGEAMHHFPGHYDASHHQRDPGFYGTRAKLAAIAKADATASGQHVRIPQPGSNVGYGSAPAQPRPASLTPSFYAPPPDSNTQQYSALRQTGSTGLHTQRINNTVSPSSTQPLGPSTSRPVSLSNGQDLWTAPIVPHGDKSAYSDARSSTPAGGNGYGRSGPLGATQQYGASSSSQGGLVDTAFVDSPEEWRYSSRGTAMTKEVELRRNTDPRNKYHIPGYQGFVRGKNFVYGDTFGKITRNCLDVPLDQPTDID